MKIVKIMLKLFLFLLLILVCGAAFLYSYSTRPTGYIVKSNKVYYAHYGLNDWKYYKSEVEGADASSFQVYEGSPDYGRDASHVFSSGTLLKNSDPNTFVITDKSKIRVDYDAQNVYLGPTLVSSDKPNYQKLPSLYSKDSKYVYFLYKPIPGADPATFEVMTEMAGSYARDKNHLYQDQNIVEDINPASVQKIGGDFWKEDQAIYYIKTKLVDADISTFQFLGGLYAKDKNQVYYQSDPIPNCDPATLDLVMTNIGNILFIKDKNHVFRAQKILEGADPSTFELIENTKGESYAYSKDKNRVWFWEEELKGVNPSTFKVLENSGEGTDGTYHYKGTERQDLALSE